MKTISLEAVLESHIEVVSIIKVGRIKYVRLDVDGTRITLKEGDKSVSTLRGEFRNSSVRKEGL